MKPQPSSAVKISPAPSPTAPKSAPRPKPSSTRKPSFPRKSQHRKFSTLYEIGPPETVAHFYEPSLPFHHDRACLLTSSTACGGRKGPVLRSKAEQDGIDE